MSALRLLGSAAIFFLHASAYLHEIDVSDRVSLTAGYHISETIQAGEGDRQSVGVIVTDDTFLPAPATRHGPSYDAGDFTLQLIQCSNHAQYLALDLKEPCPATTGEETPLGRPLKDDTLSSCHVISSVPLNDSHINLQSNWALGHLDPDAELELYLCIASPITSPMPSQLPTVFVSRVRINIDVRFKRGYLVQGLEPLRRVLIGLMLTSGPILFLHLYAHAPAPNERRLWAPSALQKETDWTRMHSVFVVVVIAKVFELVIQYTGLQRLNRTGLRDVAFAAMFDGPGIVTGCLLFIALFCATKGYMITRRRLTRRELFNMFLNALVVAAALLGSKISGSSNSAFEFLSNLIVLGIHGYLLVYVSRNARFLNGCRSLILAQNPHLRADALRALYRSLPASAKMDMCKGIQPLIIVGIVARFIVIPLGGLLSVQLAYVAVTIGHCIDFAFYVVLWIIYRLTVARPFRLPPPEDVVIEGGHHLAPRFGFDLSPTPTLSDAPLRTLLQQAHRQRRTAWRTPTQRRTAARASSPDPEEREKPIDARHYRVVVNPMRPDEVSLAEGLVIALPLEIAAEQAAYEQRFKAGAMDGRFARASAALTEESSSADPAGGEAGSSTRGGGGGEGSLSARGPGREDVDTARPEASAPSSGPATFLEPHSRRGSGSGTEMISIRVQELGSLPGDGTAQSPSDHDPPSPVPSSPAVHVAGPRGAGVAASPHGRSPSARPSAYAAAAPIPFHLLPQMQRAAEAAEAQGGTLPRQNLYRRERDGSGLDPS